MVARPGALVASAVLFGPALFLLGWVSPFLVRIASRELVSVGRTAGMLAALSTLGSFAGTLATGFVLIAWLGVARSFQLVGLALLVLAAIWFAWRRGRWIAIAPVVLGLVAQGERPLVTKVLADGTRLEERERRDGYYGSLRVVDYAGRTLRVRDLVLDGQIQGGLDLANGLPIYDYAYFLAYLPRAARPGGRTALVVGLGAGLVPRLYEAMGVRTDAVDINPGVVDAARRWFALAVSGEVVVSDARHFLATSSRRWDYVVLDVFSGDDVPGHLLSVEAVREVARRLEPSGVLAINFIGNLRGGPVTSSVVRTLREVFAHVSVHPVSDGEGDPPIANLALVASQAPLAYDPSRVRHLPMHPLAADARERMWRTWEPPRPADGIVLADDFNPVDAWELALREEIRRQMLLSTEWDVLL